jgi:DNA-binding NarL/FixJ family response regulator
MALRILLVEDHDIVRQGIAALVAAEDDFELVGEARDGREALEMAAELIPDVIVMDVMMPGLNGIEATRHIASENPDICILALSMHTDKRFIREALRAGAAGYVEKKATFGELAMAVRTVVDGGVYLSPSIAGEVTRDYILATSEDEPTGAASLTGREREILQLMAEGRTAKAIARLLGISVKTVSAHRRNIMDKLNVASTAELVKVALREGLTSLET